MAPTPIPGGAFRPRYDSVFTELQTLAAKVVTLLPSACSGAGDPIRKYSKIINGHFVTAVVIGFGAEPAIFEVDKSIEALNLEAAARKVRTR